MIAGASRLMPIVAGQWRLLSVIVAVTITYSLLAALQPWPLKILVDYGLQRQPVPALVSSTLVLAGVEPGAVELVALAALASFAVFVIYTALDVSLGWLWIVTGQRMMHELTVRLFHRLQRRSLRYHHTHGVGDALSRLSGDVWCVSELATTLLAPVEQVLVLATVGAVAWSLNSELALLSFSVAPVLAVSSAYFGRRLKERQHRTREAETRMFRFVHETLAALPVVQAFAAEARNAARFQHLASDAASLAQRRSLLKSGLGAANGTITAAGLAVVLFAGGRQVLAGTLSVGSLLVFLAYLQRLQKAVESLLRLYGGAKPLEASLERVAEALDTDALEIRDRPGARRLSRPTVRGHVRLADVTVGYAAGRPVLHHVTLDIRPGERVGLVGGTGAGKTTLLSLIPRFIDPWSGQVSLDGIDLREIQLASLRDQVAIVLQDTVLFPASMAENIAYGRPGAGRDDIVRAARAAHADDFIRALPDGYDTTLGERGATLSGGERQRLAIARALLRDAPVLLLDEPTAALDSATEGIVLAALERLMAGRTTLVIAHRLSTVRHADRILVMEDGAIVEEGDHDALVRAGGRYRRLLGAERDPAGAVRS